MEIEYRKCTLTVVTPVNIGNGTELNAKEYIYDARERKVYFLRTTAWYRYLYAHNLLEEWRRFVLDKNAKNAKDYLEKKGLKLTDLLAAGVINNVANAEPRLLVSAGQRRQSLNDVSCQVKTVEGVPYIPGSSIKGVVRTSILYHLLTLPENQRLKANYWQKISRAVNMARDGREIKQRDFAGIMLNLEATLLHKVGAIRRAEDTGGEGHALKAESDAVNSSLQALSVSDALARGDVPTAVLQKWDVAYNERENRITSKALPLCRESILPASCFGFSITLDKKIMATLGLTSVAELFTWCEEYYTYLVDLIRKADSYGDDEEIIKLLSSAENGNAFLGSNTGFLAKTLLMALAPTAEEGRKVVNTLLQKEFRNRKFSKVDVRSIAPRTLKAVRYHEELYLAGIVRLKIDE